MDPRGIVYARKSKSSGSKSSIEENDNDAAFNEKLANKLGGVIIKEDSEDLEFFKRRFVVDGGLKETLQAHAKLPEDFCGDCTLGEGSKILIGIMQVNTLAFMTIMIVFLTVIPDQVDDFWKKQFSHDFDYYHADENQDLINYLYPLWRPFAITLLAIKGCYLISGFISYYPLMKLHAATYWYLPWLVMTGFLLFCHFSMIFSLIIMVFVFMAYREVTITFDVLPILFASVYGGYWVYTFRMVLAHYKRRKVAAYWRLYYKLHGTGPYTKVIEAVEADDSGPQLQ